jgi:phage-related minor tail protein
LDKTTLTLAVDSTQVNTASVALQKMAGEGFRAETVVAKLANTAQAQGRALNAGIVKNADAAANSIKGLTSATSALSSAQDFSKTASSLSAAATKANEAAAAVRAFGAAVTTSATAGAGLSAPSFLPPKTITVQSIAQTPVSTIARNAPAGAVVESRAPVAASSAFGTLANQYAKAESASEKLTGALQAQNRALEGVAPNAAKAAASINEMAAAAAAGGAAAGIAATSSALSEAATQANAAAAAVGNMKAQAAKSSGNFSPFGSLGGASKQVEEFGKVTKLTGFQAQQLSYQVNDLFVQIASGQSPLTAMIQQGSQLNGTFGGFSGTLTALRSLITPVTVGLAGAAVGIGALGVAYVQGNRESRAFNDALALTGNYAGVTERQIGEMAKKIANSTRSSVSDVRELVTELVKTGKIGPVNLEIAADVAVRYAAANPDMKKEDVARFVARVEKSPTAAIDEINKGGTNLFSAGERSDVKKLEIKGDNEGAAAAVFAKLQQRYTKLDDNVDALGKAAQKASSIFSQFVDALKDKVTSRAGESALPALEQTANTGISGIDFSTGSPRLIQEPQSVVIAAQKEVEKAAAKEQGKRTDAAKESGKTALQVKAEEARQEADPVLLRAKPADRLKNANLRLDSAIADASKGDKPYTAAEIKALRFQTLKDNIDPEIGQMASARYSDRVQSFKDALEKEQAALGFHNQFMQGQYQAGAASVDKLYDDKVENIRKGVSAEINELDKEKAATQELLKSVIDPAQRLELQSRIKRFDVEKGKARERGRYDESLTGQEREAAQRAQTDQVDNFRANLKQSSGDDLGAALDRAKLAERQNRVFAGQTGGKITEEDIRRQTALTEAAAKYQDVQTRSGFVAQATARAEDAAYLAADLGGKSLLETENAVYAVRSKAVEQLAKLKDEAAELAKVSTDPKVKQFAADMALQYAKAAAAVDPALNRLREAQRDMASGIATILNVGTATLPQEYSKQREAANKEVKDERDKYDQKINILEGYLATTRDKNDAARLREKIKNLEAQKAGVKKESKGSSLFKAIDDNILQPMASGIFATVNKLLIADPLSKYLEGQFKSMTEGSGIFAGFFKDALGIKDAKVDPKVLAEQAAATATDTLANSIKTQTSAVEASTDALNALANAANSAAGGNSRPAVVEPGSRQAAPSFGDFTRADRALGDGSTVTDPEAIQAQQDARAAVDTLGDSTKSAAGDVAKLAAAASKGGGALGILPGIISSISAAMSAMAASSGASSSGGLFASLGKMFSSSGSTTVAGNFGSADTVSSYVFHKGGVVGGSAVSRSAPASIFDGATRYHTGGIAGGKPDGARAAIAAALKHGEIPAILMKNEEVLRRDDPRHRENLGSDLFAKLMQSKGENSASVLQGLLGRMGVKDEPAVSSALKVAGARELGGPVSAGKLYRVNERRPELLNVSGKQYLMMGSQGGRVDPNPQQQGGKGGDTHLHVNVTPPAGSNAATAAQWGTVAGRQLQRSLARNG